MLLIRFVYFVYFTNLRLEIKPIIMKVVEQIRKPSKLEQKIASESYDALASVIEQIESEQPEIEIEETARKLKFR